MTDSEPVCVLRNHHGNCTILGTGRQRVMCSGFKSDCNFKYTHDIKNKIKKHKTSISSVVAAKIASGHNQTATAIYVGKRGKGKSMAAGSVMESYAAKMCVLQGESPWEADPSKYFTIDNVGIIDMEDTLRALKRMKEPEFEYNGFILDDVGKTLDAREFMSNKNKLLNKVFQTCRTKHVFTEMTIPDDAGLDKDPRENSDYFCIMEQSLFDFNLSLGKFFEQNKQYRSGAMWYVYIRSKGSPVVRHAFKSPSPKYIDVYEPKRAAMADKLFDDSMNQLEAIINEVTEASKEKEKEKITKEGLLRPATVRLHEEGYTQRQIAEILTISVSTVNGYLKPSPA